MKAFLGFQRMPPSVLRVGGERGGLFDDSACRPQLSKHIKMYDCICNKKHFQTKNLPDEKSVFLVA